MQPLLATQIAGDEADGLASVLDMLLAGGPLMVPIALASVVALSYGVEHSVRLGRRSLGVGRFPDELLGELRQGGPERALELCSRRPSSMARVVSAGLERSAAAPAEVEKAVEDAGAREVRRLSSGLRPLVVVGMIAPLLGLLGTVWGMIQAFQNIALRDAIGKPELLAEGISQALITTAAGLAVAIPAQAAYYYFRARIDRFVQRAEALFPDIQGLLSAREAA